MVSSSFVASVLAFASTAAAHRGHSHHRRETYPLYCQHEIYEGSDLTDYFNFFTGDDPNWGFVNYVDEDVAWSDRLIRNLAGNIYIGVDYTTSLTAPDVGQKLTRRGRTTAGRKSVRLEGKKEYTHGLFILDVLHMPGGICGTWPAFWTLGSGDWPANGEIDIVEGINQNTKNRYVLHSNGQCTVDNSGASGSLLRAQCSVSDSPEGCVVEDSSAASYGTEFNKNEGGVYAMEWTSTRIRMWFFPRNAIPDSLNAGQPNIQQFGTPVADFQPSCDLDSEFKNHRLILNTNFCGDWAGNAYSSSSCPQYTGLDSIASCEKFVAENPSAFKDAYWLIKSLKVFQQSGSSSSSSASSTATSSSSSSSASPVSSSSSASSASSSSSSVASASSSSGSSAIPGSSSGSAELPNTRTSLPSETGRPSQTRNSSGSVSPRPTGTPSHSRPPHPTAGDYQTITTVITTSYVTICPTGYSTVTVTQTLTYCPACPTKPNAPPPGFTTTVTVCDVCEATPTTVTLTIPTSPPEHTGPEKPAGPAKPTGPGGNSTEPRPSHPPAFSKPSSPQLPSSPPVSPPRFTGAAAVLNAAGMVEMVGIALFGGLTLWMF